MWNLYRIGDLLIFPSVFCWLPLVLSHVFQGITIRFSTLCLNNFKSLFNVQLEIEGGSEDDKNYVLARSFKVLGKRI